MKCSVSKLYSSVTGGVEPPASPIAESPAGEMESPLAVAASPPLTLASPSAVALGEGVQDKHRATLKIGVQICMPHHSVEGDVALASLRQRSRDLGVIGIIGDPSVTLERHRFDVISN